MNNITVPRPKIIALWLFVIVFMVVAQCTIGAVTRLTESGLSIVKWEPVKGVLPPLSEVSWQDEFAKYKTSPQYQKVNAGMSLPEFKNIFWWEWVHRFWARLIGLVFALPLAFFWIKKWIPPEYKLKLLGLFALGGMQGVMGWLMVASGLVDNPAVSHYRLAAHLSLALVIAVIALRWAIRLNDRHPGDDQDPRQATQAIKNVDTGLRQHDVGRSLRAHGNATIGILFITIVYGAFVAGLDAGMIYNEFPNMGSGLVPSEFWAMMPAWLNVFENHAAVQFIHRWLGILTGVMVLAYGARGLKTQPHSKAFLACTIMGFVQPTIGIGTVLMQVPVYMGALHQLGAVILLLSLVWAQTRRAA